MCDFKPGDEVVYLGLTAKWSDICTLDRLAVGKTYTVANVDVGRCGRVGVEIEGHINNEFMYFPHEFRKVQRRSSETGMAILKSICDSPGQLEEDTKQDQVEEAARMVFGPWGDYTDDGTFGLR